MKRKLLLKTIYVLCVCLLIGSFAFSSSSISVNEEYYNGLYDFIDMMYRNDLGIDMIMGASLNGVMDKMSPYSCFELVGTGDNESYSGIGANLEKVRQGFIIVSVNPSSPAFEAGLQSGDVIHRVDKQNASAMGIETFKAYMEGKDSILIEVISKETGYINTIRIKTEPDYRNDVDYVILDNSGYIRVNAFSIDTADIVKGILGSLDSLGIDSLILDLRNLVSMNIKDACAVAELLSPGGTMARTKAGTFNTRKKDVDFNVSVLVNELTVGAGEVIASAVSSKVYGQTTAGEAYHIKRYPVFTEEAYLRYFKETGREKITGILNYLNARGIEISDKDISGYLNLVESGVFNSVGQLISDKSPIEPDEAVENTAIGYMDYKPDGDMIKIRRDYAEGSVNYDVYQAKKILAALGYFNGAMDVVFREAMTEAVNDYKSDVGYPADGILDMSIQAMLNTYSMKTAVMNDECVMAAVNDFN